MGRYLFRTVKPVTVSLAVPSVTKDLLSYRQEGSVCRIVLILIAITVWAIPTSATSANRAMTLSTPLVPSHSASFNTAKLASLSPPAQPVSQDILSALITLLASMTVLITASSVLELFV